MQDYIKVNMENSDIYIHSCVIKTDKMIQNVLTNSEQLPWLKGRRYNQGETHRPSTCTDNILFSKLKWVLNFILLFFLFETVLNCEI